MFVLVMILLIIEFIRLFLCKKREFFLVIKGIEGNSFDSFVNLDIK